ncbi:hypothetical protein [Pseudoclavibacter endophyticus]|uniref:Uncharacterized protein n=1 Tax=Pseudoclavibacter endophyticus TaxID=1778590 RepID=A0A6H9WP88_9MICO|nr:hypothetical protein [Pseudoclavibacter endophyticus]KAB1649541.1 hypothetical protein F8O04_04610 [Pseudoclavibacter endophyticus]
MSRFTPVLRNDGSLDRHRSAWKTMVCILFAAMSVAVFVSVFDNFESLQQSANVDAERVTLARNQVSQRLAPLSGLILAAAAALWFAYAAVFRCREWTRRESGNRLRRKAEFGLVGGLPLMHDLHARLSTGDPAVYTPFPPPTSKGDVGFEAWLVPEDSVAHAALRTGRGAGTRMTELLTFTGVHYEAFAAAIKNRLEVPLPNERNPLWHGADAGSVLAPTMAAVGSAPNPAADTAAALAGDATDPKLQQWAAYVRGGGRQEEHADAAGLKKARAWNSGILVVSAVVLAGGAAALLALSSFEHARASLLITLAVFLGLLAVAFIPRIALLRRNLGDTAGPEAVVAAEGIEIRGLPVIAWNEILGIVYLDDRQRTERALSVPVTGWGLRLAFKAGEGSIGLTIAVRDGVGLRSRVTSRDTRSAVKLWPRGEHGLRGGTVTTRLDVRLTPEARERFIAAARGGAVTAGVPFHLVRGVLDNAKFLGRMLDPKWGDTP